MSISYEINEVFYPLFAIATRCFQLLDNFVEIFSAIVTDQSALSQSVHELFPIVSSFVKIVEHLRNLRRDAWNWIACELNIGRCMQGNCTIMIYVDISLLL